MGTILELIGLLEWGVSNADAFHVILTDVEDALVKLGDSGNPFVLPAGQPATPFARVQALIAWGEKDLPALTKVVTDIRALVAQHQAAAAAVSAK